MIKKALSLRKRTSPLPVSQRMEDSAMEAPVKDCNDELEGSSITFALSEASDTVEDASLVSSIKSSLKRTHRTVQFSTVEIHEHAVELGGNIPSQGAPLTLSWERQANYVVPLDDYETHRPPTRKGRQLVRDAKNRFELLLENGYTMRGIQNEIREADLLRKQRMQTARSSGAWGSKLIGKFQKILERSQK